MNKFEQVGVPDLLFGGGYPNWPFLGGTLPYGLSHSVFDVTYSPLEQTDTFEKFTFPQIDLHVAKMLMQDGCSRLFVSNSAFNHFFSIQGFNVSC